MTTQPHLTTRMLYHYLYTYSELIHYHLTYMLCNLITNHDPEDFPLCLACPFSTLA